MQHSSGLSFFIVDDDPFWLALIDRMLRSIGYSRIFNFDNAIDCLNQLSKEPDIIFLDYEMENMNGLEALSKIKNYNPWTGVVLCSAKEDMGLAINAIKYGSYDFLLKQQVDAGKLGSIIVSLMDNIAKEMSARIF